jgi:hypothetical protein
MSGFPGASPGRYAWVNAGRAGASLGNTPRPAYLSNAVSNAMARGQWGFSDFTKLFNGLGDVRAAQGVSSEFLSTAESAQMMETAAELDLRVTALLEEAAGELSALEASSASSVSSSLVGTYAGTSASTLGVEATEAISPLVLGEAAVGAEATVAASASAAALSAPMVAAMVVAVAAVVGGIVYLAGGFDDVKREFATPSADVDPKLVPVVGPGRGFMQYQDRSGPFHIDPALRSVFC